MNLAARRTKALLLAGGLGTRLKPLTDTVPKCLVEIGGRPLLQFWFDALAAAGVRDAMINTHHLPGPVREFLASKRAEGFRVDEAYEPTLLGSAGTIAAAPAFADDTDDVIVIYADNLSDVDLGALLGTHRREGQPMTMLLFRTPRPSASGIAALDARGMVVEFVEKPAQPKSDLANAGVYVVTASAWREIAAMRAFDIGFEVLPRFVGRMHGHLHPGYHRDIGTLDALEGARADLARGVTRFHPQPLLHTGTNR